MKKNSVIKVQMNCEKCRKKALQIAAGAEGVISVTNEGKDNELIAVVGISVDPVCLVDKLRKKVGHAELISITEVKEPAKEKSAEDKEKKPPCQCHYWGPPPPFHPCPQQLIGYSTVYEEQPSVCSLM